jgi:hypothetical protein
MVFFFYIEGDIYRCVVSGTNEVYAAKLEVYFMYRVQIFYFYSQVINSPMPQLIYEVKLYKILMGGTGIPQVCNSYFFKFINLIFI